MHVVLFPLGSAGDVFPFLWLGRHLRARGHRVTVVVACVFEEVVRKAGLEVVPMGTPELFDRFISDPRVWKLYQGTKLVFEFAGENTEPVLAVVESLIQQGARPDLLLAPCTVFGARLAREKHGIPLISVHVQPAVLISAHETPVLFPGMQHFRKLPLTLRQWLVRLPNPADRFAAAPVRAACARHGVAAPRRLWWEWADSPDGVLALFPEWFARPQPDWPPQLLQWHFPLEDIATERPLSSEVTDFLAEGTAPIVFTPGSANIQARRFFEVALSAVTTLGERAIFVTRDLSQLPSPLPSRVLAVEYAPFSTLIPHASVFVHHGGIGTLSQGFAAGVPQLIMAMAHDQPDNAYRLEQLGAGIGLSPRTFTPRRVSQTLHRLLTEPRYQQAALRCQQHIQQRPAVEALTEWIESRTLG
ncbi:UDP:flavonoid glycosyltransferase YjiC, YdhE family [Prosthecobacter debontii]|uniref:UDP:flavonoid glycosyltransferase YjiC, YdhE family n=1 Tax=Prosthecobacter debontii TaxID=48467 RepID=A0A1T4YZP5_9BACT|nr:glycosyltransferase [Prosthecobacter debontii]SKB07244.1 UDP:flavonoid glycosyltransferase YjiC, YdhE family [Prosthecobacter debontii]